MDLVRTLGPSGCGVDKSIRQKQCDLVSEITVKTYDPQQVKRVGDSMKKDTKLPKKYDQFFLGQKLVRPGPPLNFGVATAQKVYFKPISATCHGVGLKIANKGSNKY